MGWWDVIQSAVKEPVTNAYQGTYDLGRAAASKIDEGVRIHGDGVKQKVKEYLPGPEGREKIIQALTHPATKEAIKFVAPGGAQAAYNIVGSLLLGKNQNDEEEQNKYEHVIQEMKVLQAENERMQKELNKLMIINNNSSSSSTVSEQMPEVQKLKTEN